SAGVQHYGAPGRYTHICRKTPGCAAKIAAIPRTNSPDLLPMYLVHTPQYVQALFPGLIWKMSGKEPNIYLTFDDGPIPEVTPWVLDTLRAYDAKATFFCVGDNVRKYPEIFDALVREGHTVGNHTHNHLSGWS